MNHAVIGSILIVVGLGPLVTSTPLTACEAASYGPTHHDYPATDIFVTRGTRFVAVTSGIVEAVSRIDRWTPDLDRPWTRGGRFVSLERPDRFEVELLQQRITVVTALPLRRAARTAG